MSPDDVTIEKQPEIFKRRYSNLNPIDKNKNELKVGTYVRTKLQKSIFAKSFTKSFSDEIFEIKSKQTNKPRAVYKLETLDGEPVLGFFYCEQLSPVVK